MGVGVGAHLPNTDPTHKPQHQVDEEWFMTVDPTIPCHDNEDQRRDNAVFLAGVIVMIFPIGVPLILLSQVRNEPYVVFTRTFVRARATARAFSCQP